MLMKHCFLIVSVPELTWSDGSHDSCKLWKTTTWWRVPGPHKTKNKTGTWYQGPREECPRGQYTQGDLYSTELLNLFEDDQQTRHTNITSIDSNILQRTWCIIEIKYSLSISECLAWGLFKHKMAKFENGTTVNLQSK